MNAPPRKKPAPAFCTSLAISVICSSDSTEQGPATIISFLPPTVRPAMSSTVLSGWNIRFAFLNGSATCTTRSTLRLASMRLGSILLVSPTRPKMVRSVPYTGFTSTPCAVRLSASLSISFCSVMGFIMTIMFGSS